VGDASAFLDSVLGHGVVVALAVSGWVCGGASRPSLDSSICALPDSPELRTNQPARRGAPPVLGCALGHLERPTFQTSRRVASRLLEAASGVLLTRQADVRTVNGLARQEWMRHD
jgi:hypothetical protein